MITKEILEKGFITAYFIDNPRTQIEVVTRDGNAEDEVITTVIEYDMSHPWCQTLFEFIDLDTLHENTWTRINEQRKEFRRVALKIAEQDGVLAEIKKSVSMNALEMLKRYIFEFDQSFPENKTEELFNFKLWLFDLDELKNCQDNDLKSRLRKSKSPKEALQIVFEIK